MVKRQRVLETLRQAPRDKVLQLVAQRGLALEYVSAELKADREVVMAAVRQDAWALEHASEELQGDRQVVMAAVLSDGSAFSVHVHDEGLRADRELVLTAVQHDVVDDECYALSNACVELRSDRELVLAAVRRNGWALQHAAEHLQADRDLVAMAVQSNGFSLQHASEELRTDPELVRLAVQQNPAQVGQWLLDRFVAERAAHEVTRGELESCRSELADGIGGAPEEDGLTACAHVLAEAVGHIARIKAGLSS